MLATKLCLISVFFVLVFSQVTKVVKYNPLLSRKKRYLTFPENSNFVITLSFIKAFLQQQPTGWNLLGECDVPFPLPSDTRWFEKNPQIHKKLKREAINKIETAFSQGGLDGSSCVRRMICEMWQYKTATDKSMVKDMLSAILTSLDDSLNSENYEDLCPITLFQECGVSFLSYILNSFLNS